MISVGERRYHCERVTRQKTERHVVDTCMEKKKKKKKIDVAREVWQKSVANDAREHTLINYEVILRSRQYHVRMIASLEISFTNHKMNVIFFFFQNIDRSDPIKNSPRISYFRISRIRTSMFACHMIFFNVSHYVFIYTYTHIYIHISKIVKKKTVLSNDDDFFYVRTETHISFQLKPKRLNTFDTGRIVI